jgi:hypothetical protein
MSRLSAVVFKHKEKSEEKILYLNIRKKYGIFNWLSRH